MINFLHNFNPNAILISFGSVNIYWYGLFIVSAILIAIAITIKLSSYYNIEKNKIIDLIFWIVIGGIIGARIYYIFLEFPYYLSHPLNILKIWQGGLAIHGALIAGLIIIVLFSKKEKINFWLLSGIISPGLALAQAIGRWGNYFNQELFGKPTELPWGIPINIINRPLEYISSNFFHPAFLYESIGNFFIFIILILIHILIIKKKNDVLYIIPVIFYMIAYSILRVFMESIRIDIMPKLFGMRFSQLISLLIILLSILIFIKPIRNKLT